MHGRVAVGMRLLLFSCCFLSRDMKSLSPADDTSVDSTCGECLRLSLSPSYAKGKCKTYDSRRDFELRR